MSVINFCPDPLWDTNLTWNTQNPEFTICFEKTILVYVPSFVLAVLAPVQYTLATASRDNYVPWSLLNVLRLFLNFCLVIMPIVDLGILLATTGNVSGSTVFIVADVVKALTYALAIWLQLVIKKHGIVTSGIMLLFWTITAFAGLMPFRSLFLNDQAGLTPAFVISTLEYPMILTILFLACWADPKPRDIALEDQMDDLTPEKYSSALSKVVFGWMEPLIYRGWSKQLDKSDLWTLITENRASKVVPNWDSNWEEAEKKSKSKGVEISILPVMIKSFGPPYLMAAFLTLVLSVLQFASPQIVNLLIAFVQSDDPDWKGYFYTVLIVVVTFVCTVLNAQAFYQEYLVGLRIRTALISAIYRKSLKLSNASRKEMTVGETTNLMQIDTQKFMDLALYLNLVWSSPLQIVLAMYFLWTTLGPSALAGLAVMILMGPINAMTAKKMKKYQLQQMKNKDQRIKIMDEILNGIKILKLYAWETSFQDKVKGIRESEIVTLKKTAYLNAFTTFLWICAPVVVALASFATFVLISEENILDANTAFVSLTLFNLLRVPLNVLPVLIIYLIQCQVSLKRVNKFMNSEELDPNAVTHNPVDDAAVSVKNGSFSWDRSTNCSLKNLNLSVKPGSLIAVVGTVGSGKSSLLSALLGEMNKVSGNVNSYGSVAYVPQQAWIQNATVQYNVIFGKEFDKKKYNKVLEACALMPDLKILPGGDQTEIGEKGINLSGGQKQRISMARSVYNDAQIYYLDDPLSAVDAHVGSHIFEKVIGANGLLKNKTRILVTHGVKYLPKVDKIVVMKDGEISEQGTYNELLKDGGPFAEFLMEYLADEVSSDEEDYENLKSTLESVMGKERFNREMSHARSVRSNASSERRSLKSEGQRLSTSTRLRPRQDSQLTTLSVPESGKSEKKNQPGQNLIEDEQMQSGSVKLTIYTYYIKCVGIWMSVATLILYSSFMATSVGNSIWLSRWSTDPLATSDIPTRNMYLSVYGVLGLLQAIFIMLSAIILSVGTLNAASKLHGTMLERILRSPMSFFDTTPLGRILNRFSKDIDIVDVTLPMILRGLVNNLLSVLGTIIVICYANPYFIAVIVPVFILFYILQRFYIATARQIKRMESVSRSPIYSHFGETISGAITIRAFNMIKSFVDQNEMKIDNNQRCYYPTFVCSRWLAVRLETLGNLLVFFASLFAVLTRDKMDPGLVGLSLSNALTVTNSLSYLVSMASEVETNMVGVERIKEYQEIEEEAPLFMPEQDPPAEWPEYGMIKFDDYQTRYRPGLDLVLKGINCHIRPGEKVGIVGRTGAGKSSLTLALFRIIESSGGGISIDDQNIGLMGLYRLRSRLTIIPQEPVLFSGSLRMNLDPFNEKSDDAIWRALDQAHLKAYVTNLASGLNFEVNEGGENLSVGQRQLVCLARALLRKTKVLVLDEATAAVDLETDDLIQATIRKEFSDCTVLTIAHRLNTIMDSSKVMVLDNGRVIEYDSPGDLLRKTNSVFYGMAKEAGLLGSQQSQGKKGKKGSKTLRQRSTSFRDELLVEISNSEEEK